MPTCAPRGRRCGRFRTRTSCKSRQSPSSRVERVDALPSSCMYINAAHDLLGDDDLEDGVGDERWST